uniref:Uncharacterized protein n=1 Tax=Neobodo designis TaxID=312471 RepID=A0A7S1W2P1_NEODS|mmetsp:Transcript_5040/g.15923  ORF Transcript_5040/g.15923 Transcript_5040/m.15923 type:complete len:277 (+) Transcript_5040:31-861(+)
MSRVKLGAELQQEAADEHLARQMMMHEERAPAQRPRLELVPQEQQRWAKGPNQVVCLACHSINNVNPANLQFRHMCGTCRRLLPQMDPPPAPQQQHPLDQQTRTVLCQHCDADNVIPESASRAFKCGHCQQLLQGASAHSGSASVHVPYQQRPQSPSPPLHPSTAASTTTGDAGNAYCGQPDDGVDKSVGEPGASAAASSTAAASAGYDAARSTPRAGPDFSGTGGGGDGGGEEESGGRVQGFFSSISQTWSSLKDAAEKQQKSAGCKIKAFLDDL